MIRRKPRNCSSQTGRGQSDVARTSWLLSCLFEGMTRYNMPDVPADVPHVRSKSTRRATAVNRPWWAFSLILVSALQAAELKPEAVKAWNQYVDSADATMQARLRPGRPFLWIDEAPDRRQQLRAGEILAASVGDQTPKKVPSGLIHHWIGAAFFPNVKLDGVLSVVRDYSHYKDYYHPVVVDSRAIQQTPSADRFSILLTNKALLMKTTFESEYESRFGQAGSKKWYNVATAIRLQEIEDYGQSSERRLPLDEGSGYVWRLHSITRYQEADGGVYVEVEAMALSRDIPAAARWVVDPIVRRISKSAMVTTLRQSLDAVNSSRQAVADRSVAIPAIPRLASGFLPALSPRP